MKVLLAVSFLLWATAESHHTQEHNLRYPPFQQTKTHEYELFLNLTSGIPGLASQVSKSVITALVKIYPKTKTDYLLKIENVRISEAVPSYPSDDAEVLLREVPRLEAELSRPIRFTLRDGKILSYILHKSESPEAARIKRSILRHMEVELLEKEESYHPGAEYPYTYNTTKDTPYGPVKTWYVVNVSPYVEFPYDQNVFNISKTEVYEWTGYPAAHYHHNFAKQGCPEVCRLNSTSLYQPGCPYGYEPTDMPVRISTVTHCNLWMKDRQMVLDSMQVAEKHVASMYDQDMVVRIRSEYKLKDITEERISEPDYPAQEYTDLDSDIEPQVEKSSDIPEETRYLTELYPHISGADGVRACRKHLDDIVKAVSKGDLNTRESQMVGEKLILLQKVMTLFANRDFNDLWRRVVTLESFQTASEEKKLERQLIVEILPLIGTESSIEFIQYLIKKEKVCAWEAKEMLESIPENLMTKDTKTVLKYLHELLNTDVVRNEYLVFSSAHLTLARVIRRSCVSGAIRNATEPSDIRPRNMLYTQLEKAANDEFREGIFSGLLRGIRPIRQTYPEVEQCPEKFVKKFIEEITKELKETKAIHEKVIYIETLAHIGSKSVIPSLLPYVYGTAEDVSQYADGDVDFLKTVTIYALHHVIGYYPHEILGYVLPVYFNRTEVPRVRLAAFSVVVRCHPSVATLKHIAADSWEEPSYEVGSYVYATIRSLGNSSEPCMKLTAKRIKHVISEFKSYDIGHHHAETLIKSFFDKIRNFGFTLAKSYIPSNESFIPYSAYSGAAYNVDSLRDDLWKLAVNIQGVPMDKLMELIDLEVLNITWPEFIPRESENKIFGSLNILPRLPKTLRICFYRKIFYSTWYAYFDTRTFRSILKPLWEHFTNVYRPEKGVVRGNFVKIFIPSSYHTLSIGRTTAFPIEFYMKHPILLSVKAESTLHTYKPLFTVRYEIKPCVYYTVHHEKHVINPVDKKAYGVYYEQKYAFTLPMKFYLHFNHKNNTLVMSLKYPEPGHKIFTHHSEAGTYASELKLTDLPSTLNRDPIRTIPTLFQKDKIVSLPGLPPVYFISHSEDISEWVKSVPRDLKELVGVGFECFRNPGWRKKGLNITILEDKRHPVHSVLLQLSYNRTDEFFNEQRMNVNEINQLIYATSEELNDIHSMREGEKSDPGLKLAEAKKLYKAIADYLSHVYHEFELRLVTSPTYVDAGVRIEYNHTYDRMIHTFKANATCYTERKHLPYEASFAHVLRYKNVPSEFKYDITRYSSQRADCYCAFHVGKHELFEDPDMKMTGSSLFVPYQELFSETDFPTPLRKEWILPETHAECMEDIRNGKSLSIACLRAIREISIFNRYKIKAEWKREIPPVLLNVTHKIDQAIKYALYSNVDINRVNVENPPSTLTISADYVDRLTDVPVVNVHVRAPTETAHYHNVNAKYLYPLSGLYTSEDSILKYFTNNTYPPTCYLMKSYIQTFDLKSFELPKDKCTYLLSAHCTKRKTHAVFVRDLESSKREVDIHLGEHLIRLTPSRSESTYVVEYDSRKYTIRVEKPVMFNEEQRIHAFIMPQVFKGQKKYVLAIHADAAHIRLHYDNSHVKLRVHPFYKGLLCGLCSEFDGEVTREYKGVDQCLYSGSEDFARSALVNPQECGASKAPKAPVMCPYGKATAQDSASPRSWHYSDDDENRDTDSDEQNLPTELKTIHMQHGDFICFSTRPVLTCKDGMRPAETELRNVEFHCLPKYDSTTRRLLIESETRPLHELENKSVDFISNLSIPKSCERL